MRVKPQNLPIPQTQVPSAPSSSLCPENLPRERRRPAKPSLSGFAGPTTTRKPWYSSNRVALCQATLSIGLYLLLEGAVPTPPLYLSRRRVNLQKPSLERVMNLRGGCRPPAAERGKQMRRSEAPLPSRVASRSPSPAA